MSKKKIKKLRDMIMSAYVLRGIPVPKEVVNTLRVELGLAPLATQGPIPRECGRK